MKRTKMARARRILNNYIKKEGVYPNRQEGMKLLLKRIDMTEGQASTYYYNVWKEVA